MPSLREIESVIKKILTIEDLKGHICFFGGSIPYIFHNQESNREHSDIDILVDSNYIDNIREMLKSYNLYNPELDSLNLDLDMDYGLKAYINGTYVEFEPMSYDNGIFTKASFSPNSERAGVETIPCDIEDIMIPVVIDGHETLFQSMEMIMAEKEMYRREKDIKDIEFINSKGIDIDKYLRIQEALKKTVLKIDNYGDIRANKGQTL